MGSFDIVYVQCPECNTLETIQSKGGSCLLIEYKQDWVPGNVAGVLHNREFTCKKCGFLGIIKIMSYVRIIKRKVEEEE